MTMPGFRLRCLVKRLTRTSFSFDDVSMRCIGDGHIQASSVQFSG